MSKIVVKDGGLLQGWRKLRLHEVASVKTGPFGTQLHQHDYVQSGGTPIITVEHLSERGLVHKNLPLVSHQDKQRLSQYLIQEGDIVFSRVGSVDRSVLIKKNEDGWLFSGRLLRVRPRKYDVYSPYLNYFFHTRKFRHHMRRIAVGGIMPSINTSILSNVTVQLPPFDEQRAIASLLETWDRAIEKTEGLIAAKKKRFEWLLSALIGQRQSSANWDKSKLVEVGRFSKGNGITKEDLAAEGIPCIRYGELYTRHNFRIQNFCSFISHKNAGRYKLIENNDLLFAGSGETREEIGKCASFNHNIEARAGGDVIICSIDPRKLRADFASYFLNTRGRRLLSKLGQGNSIVHIYSRFLESVEVPIPPLHEQEAITSLLKTCETEINKMEEIAEKYRTQKRGLMQKLLSGKWRVLP